MISVKCYLSQKQYYIGDLIFSPLSFYCCIWSIKVQLCEKTKSVANYILFTVYLTRLYLTVQIRAIYSFYIYQFLSDNLYCDNGDYMWTVYTASHVDICSTNVYCR